MSVFLQDCLGNLNSTKPPLVGPSCRTERRGYHHCLKRNSTFFRIILLIPERMLILLWQETQGCLYCSELLLFGYIYLHGKPLLTIGNISTKHFQEKEWKVFLNVCYHEIEVKHQYCIDIGLSGYFEWNILSCGLLVYWYRLV